MTATTCPCCGRTIRVDDRSGNIRPHLADIRMEDPDQTDPWAECPGGGRRWYA